MTNLDAAERLAEKAITKAEKGEAALRARWDELARRDRFIATEDELRAVENALDLVAEVLDRLSEQGLPAEAWDARNRALHQQRDRMADRLDDLTKEAADEYRERVRAMTNKPPKAPKARKAPKAPKATKAPKAPKAPKRNAATQWTTGDDTVLRVVRGRGDARELEKLEMRKLRAVVEAATSYLGLREQPDEVWDIARAYMDDAPDELVTELAQAVVDDYQAGQSIRANEAADAEIRAKWDRLDAEEAEDKRRAAEAQTAHIGTTRPEDWSTPAASWEGPRARPMPPTAAEAAELAPFELEPHPEELMLSREQPRRSSSTRRTRRTAPARALSFGAAPFSLRVPSSPARPTPAPSSSDTAARIAGEVAYTASEQIGIKASPSEHEQAAELHDRAASLWAAFPDRVRASEHRGNAAWHRQRAGARPAPMRLPKGLPREAGRVIRREHGDRVRTVRHLCRQLRADLGLDAKRRREALRHAIAVERLALRGNCADRLAEARAETDRRIEEARESMVELHKLRQVTRAPHLRGAERARHGRAESIKESDDEVRRNLPDELARVWDKVKSRPGMKKSKRRSRTEAFVEWVEAHPDEVSRMLADVGEYPEESEAAYAVRMAASSKPKRKRRELAPDFTITLEDLPF